MPLPCKVKICGSETVCTSCGYVWDTNDPEPPRCPYATRQDDLGVKAGFVVFIAAIVGLTLAFVLLLKWLF